MAKTIVFKYRYGHNDSEIITEEHEFDDDVTEDEINEAYIEFMLQQVSDSCTWYEKETK